MEQAIRRNCNSCKHGLFASCDDLRNDNLFQQMKITEAYEYKENHICGDYKCRFIEYPITVNDIVYETKTVNLCNDTCGKYVKIRPCGEEYGGNTYLGLFLGDLPSDVRIRYDEDSGIIKAGLNSNPAIFVFDLNKVIYGYESWWGVIRNESDLTAITDKDIDNVWYVKALKQIAEE